MKPWDIFKRGVGCLTLSITLLLGLLIGYCICWFEEWATPYIDRKTAVRHGLENAQAHCRDAAHPRPVDCVHFRLTDVQEQYWGWGLTFTSADGRRTDSMIIRRKGEYDGTGRTDLDDPYEQPVRTVIGPRQDLPAAPTNGNVAISTTR